MFFVCADHPSGLEIKNENCCWIFTCWFRIHRDLISLLNVNGYERWHLIHIFFIFSSSFKGYARGAKLWKSSHKNEQSKVYVKCQGWKFNFSVIQQTLKPPSPSAFLWLELSFLPFKCIKVLFNVVDEKYNLDEKFKSSLISWENYFRR